RRWRRYSRRTASGFTFRATGTAKRRSIACTWRSWWRRRRWSRASRQGRGSRELGRGRFDAESRRRRGRRGERQRGDWEGAVFAPSPGLRAEQAEGKHVRAALGWRGQEACPTLPAGLFFRRGEVADDEVLLDLVDHELVRLPRLGGVELDRLVDRLFSFFCPLF